MAIIRRDEGKRSMDTTRILLNKLIADEQRALRAQRVAPELYLRHASTSRLISSLSAVGMLGIVAVLIGRNLRQRDREAESERTQREWLEVTLSSVADAVIATDASGHVSFMNEAATALTGYAINGEHTAQIDNILRLEQTPKLRGAGIQVLTQRDPLHASDAALQRADGTQVLVDLSISPIKRSDGAVLGVVAAFRDVSERQRDEIARALLVEASALLSSSLEEDELAAQVARASVAGFAERCAVYVRRPGEPLQCIALVDSTMRYNPACSDDPVPVPIVQAIQHGTTLVDPQPFADVVAYSDAPEQPPVAQLITPLSSRGQTIGAFVFDRMGSPQPFDERDIQLGRDVARRTALALDNARLFQETRAAVATRDVFLSIASHELKTPLTSLLGQAQLMLRRLLREPTTDERDRRSLRVIVEQATRMNHMIATMLDISQIESGRLRLDSAQFDIAGLTQRIIEENQPVHSNHAIVYDGETTPIVIDGDAIRIEQVIQNLLQNAVKYSPSGGVVVVRLVHNGTVQITVSDQGIGIPQVALGNLFERFYRAGNAGRASSGLGIGLYIVKEIVELHGGTVDVASTEGEGSSFTIVLPISPPIDKQQ